MIKFLGIAICVLFCSLMLKDKNKPIAILLSFSGALLLFFTASSELRRIIDAIFSYSSSAPQTLAYSKLMLKILAITLLTQLVSDFCRDNGESALASMTEAVAKIVVISLILPLFETVISIVGGLVK